jgi:hypothetical protein
MTFKLNDLASGCKQQNNAEKCYIFTSGAKSFNNKSSTRKKRRVRQECDEESQITIVYNKKKQNGAMNGWSNKKMKESYKVR